MENINKKPKVMVLGTFHMRYTPDLHRVDFDNLLSSKRQEEIRKVVNGLKNYNPTKIAVEVVKENDNLINKEYQQYINGQLELKVDEIHQFGFRTAAELEHKNIYAVDWMESVGNRAISQVFDWVKIEQPDLYNLIDEKYRSKLQLNLDDRGIFELVCNYNEEQFIKKQHEMYMQVARIGKGTEYVGIDWVRWWYQRNLIIYSNLAQITNSSSDRTLLIIGAAHVYLISQFLRESGLFEVVSVNDYLK
ncbi:DUF5694 domain-containing protein [Paenisporosarcina sp. TG20]|uniref:DUF5694 domain-containing protein n=1 Tax=Paenisporosarcina sp. TG20 TaxID=1211706 RepID=UPI0002D9488E|nr:DUF5694 domain-containing protein [Paenisporosarcina sp. TG20]